MGRKKKIEDEDIILLIDQFYLNERDKFSKKPKLVDIADFIRKNGYDIEDRILNRNVKARKRIDELEANSFDTSIKLVSVYHTFDIDHAIKNWDRDKFYSYLKEREAYYFSLAKSTANILKKYDALEKERDNLKEEKSILEKKIESLDNANYKKTIKEDKITISKLFKIINTYLYPEIANEVLKEEEIIISNNEYIDTSKIDDLLIHSDTNINEFANNSINKLLESLDEKL